MKFHMDCHSLCLVTQSTRLIIRPKSVHDWLSGAFAKLRRATIKFLISILILNVPCVLWWLFYKTNFACNKCLSCLSARLSVRSSVLMEQLGSNYTDFQEILFLSIFRKSVEKIQVSLKSGKNNGYFCDDQLNLW